MHHIQPPLPILPMHVMLGMNAWQDAAVASCANESQAAPQKRAALMLKGIARYYGSTYTRSMPEASCVWQHGNARLLDYGLGHIATTAIRQVTLFVPSLINRYYVLDLEHKRSFLRYLLTQGIYPLVMDWGVPGALESSFACQDYIEQMLLPAVDYINKATNQPVSLAGYCMGGVLALAAAQLAGDQVAKLGLFATPWNFHCQAFLPLLLDQHNHAALHQLLEHQQEVPAHLIQSLFYLTDPWVFEQKFCRFAKMRPGSRAEQDFMALEHWVNDGVPMTAGVARDCLLGWAQHNDLFNNTWQVGATSINPAQLSHPTFMAIPQHDHVVPMDCALPLTKALPHATVIFPNTGHVGMIVGSKARIECWQPFARWLKQH